MARTKKPRGRRFVTTVHARGAAPLDAMLDLTERASKAAPLEEVLASLTEQIASLLAVDVCSIYLRETAAQDGGRRRAGAARHPRLLRRRWWARCACASARG